MRLHVPQLTFDAARQLSVKLTRHSSYRHRYNAHTAILALTGPAASQVHLFSASTGHLAWSVNQHSPERGLLPEPGSIAADAVFASTSQDSDVFTLANGRDVRLISGKTGDVVWEYTIDLPTE